MGHFPLEGAPEGRIIRFVTAGGGVVPVALWDDDGNLGTGRAEPEP